MVTNVDVGTINTNFSSDKNSTKCVLILRSTQTGRAAEGLASALQIDLRSVCYTTVPISLAPVNHSSENEISA